jgi:hypothetical protein
MRCLQQSTEFFGGDQGDILGATAVDDHDLTVGRDFVAERRKVRTSVGIRRLDCYTSLPMNCVQEDCTTSCAD